MKQPLIEKIQVTKKVLTGGAFDLLHHAHVLFLEECKRIATSKQGLLVVQINSDARIKKKKGPSRPILPEKDRASVVQALRCVDAVVCLSGYEEYPFYKIAEIVKPGVIIVNEDEFADYSKEQAYCDEHSIELLKIPRIIAPSGLDTTKIVAKIKAS